MHQNTTPARCRKPDRQCELITPPTLERPGTLRIDVFGRESTFYAVEPIREAAWGTAFLLTKEDRTFLAVNLGDPAQGIHPTCDCADFNFRGHLGPCKHLESLAGLVAAGKL